MVNVLKNHNEDHVIKSSLVIYWWNYLNEEFNPYPDRTESVISLFHQYRVRRACTSMQSVQANVKYLSICIPTKMGANYMVVKMRGTVIQML